MWIDTHCHFDADEFESDRQVVAECAAAVGVEAIVIPGYVASRWEHLLGVCRTVTGPKLHPAPGLHPCYIREHLPLHLEQLDAVLRNFPCAAVGEIGLDTYLPELKSPELFQAQVFFFTEQLRLAQTHDKPVILHVRKAHAQVFKILRERRFKAGGIVHAFSGGVEEAKHYYRLGFRLGIGGSLSYPQARRLHAVVEAMPLEALVIETDAPDMIPAAERGQGIRRNSPEFLPGVAAVLAAVKGVDTTRLSECLRDNSCRSLRLNQ
ncbi:MAG TPA: TatD family hydrolase [Fluviicoccus sp.]|nr:TatD family hydrolase [Fluviicoccus sp.]